MSYSKLLDIVGTFDQPRWSNCKNHVLSRYRIDTKERVLFEQLFKHRRTLDHKNLRKKELFLLLFQEGENSSFSNLTTRLCKSLEDFIVIDELISEEYRWDRQMILLKYYKKQGLSKYFLKESVKLIEEQQDLSEYDLSKRLRLFLTRLELGFSELDITVRTPFFFEAARDLDLYWNNMHLLFATEKSNRKILFSEERDEADPEEVNPLFMFLRQLNSLVVNKDEDSYQKVKEELFIVYPMLSDKLAEISMIYLFNYCWFKIKQGNKPVQYELLELYERGVDTEILLKNGFLSESQFLNIIEAKSNLMPDMDHKEYAEHWFQRTETRYPAIVRSIALAYIHFGREEYREALDLLEGQEHRAYNMNLALRSRWMSICCLWALEPDRPNFDVVLGTYEKYFRRKKEQISHMNFKGSLNLLKTIRMFWEEKEWDLVAAKVAGYEYLIFRNWVEKIIKSDQTDKA